MPKKKRRDSDEIKKEILTILYKEGPSRASHLRSQIKTGYSTILDNSKFLKEIGLIEKDVIETSTGKIILFKLTKQGEIAAVTIRSKVEEEP